MSVVLIYQAGENHQQQLSKQTLSTLVSERLVSFPLFHRKLLRIPMGMDAPYWIDVEQPHWARHIFQHELGDDAGWPEFEQQLGLIHGKQMNMRAPLWEMHLLQGLREIPGVSGNFQALVLKIHHSAADGISLAAVVQALHLAADDSQAPPRPRPANRQPPNRMELWALANLNSMARQFKLMETARKVLPKVLQGRPPADDLPQVSSRAARFNARIEAGRACGTVLIKKPELVAIKRSVRHVTLNDIALCCVAGALREYLQAKQQLPKQSLAAGVPMSLRKAGQRNKSGNQIATMIVGLASNVAEPVERLRLIHRFAVQGKKHIQQLGSDSAMQISDSLAPVILAEGVKTLSRASRAALLPVPFHTMVSNVPGPASALYLGKAKLLATAGFGPVRDNMGLFHVVSNSDAYFSLSFNACQKLLPDPQFYRHCLENSFAALYDSAHANT